MIMETVESIPFAELDFMAMHWLLDLACIRRTQTLPALVYYHLSDDELGEIGQLAVRKDYRSGNTMLTRLIWKDAPRPALAVKAEYDRLETEHPDWTPVQLATEAHKEARQVGQDLHERRRQYMKDVRGAFYSKLYVSQITADSLPVREWCGNDEGIGNG